MKESFLFDCLQVLIAARYDFLLGRCYFLFCLCVLGLHERICPINSDLFALQIRSNELEQSGLTTHTDIYIYMTVYCLAGLGGQWSFLGGWFNKVKQMPILAQVNIDPK